MAPKSTKQKIELVAEVLAALEEARVRLGLSREDFCNKAALSYQTWMYWNRGDTAPNLVSLSRLLKAHNLHLTIATEGNGGAYSDDTSFIANLIQLMPPDGRAEVREFVMKRIASGLERAHKSKPPVPADAPDDAKR